MKEFKKGFLNGVKLLVLLGLVIGLTGCEDPNATKPVVRYGTTVEGATIVGTWTSTYGEKFEITNTTLTQTGTEYNGKTYQMKGNIIDPSGDDFSAEHGYLILEVTSERDTWDDSDRTGKFIAIHWKSLDINTIELSSAYKATGVAYKDSAAEARAEFTTDNGYFATYSTCTK